MSNPKSIPEIFFPETNHILNNQLSMEAYTTPIDRTISAENSGCLNFGKNVMFLINVS